MTRDPEQATADLRREVRRLVESATAEQLEAMRDAWGDADDFPTTDVLVLRPDGNTVAELFYNACTEAADTEDGTCGILADPCPLHGARKSRSDSRQLQPGQRVTIPARYPGEGCHGVRVGTVAAWCYGEIAPVEVPGHGFVQVPIGEVEPA